jgi:hypothetical protein
LLEIELAAVKKELKLTDDDFTNYLSEEVSYLNSLKSIPISETIKIQYVKALIALDRFR